MALDTLIVRTPPTDPSRVVTVTATTPNGKSGSASVRIN
jgi:hypothetical protein